jgi:hypothetical protein
LERDLGGDNCHNIDRILRVPFTTNVADSKKLAKSRKDAVPELSQTVFSTAIDRSDTRPLDDNEFALVCGLPFSVARRAASTEVGGGSRNEKQIGINTDLVRAGVDDQLHYRMMWDKVRFPFLFDAIHFTPKGGARPKAAEYAERQIIKAKTFAEKERMKSEARVAKLARCGPEKRPEVLVDQSSTISE